MPLGGGATNLEVRVDGKVDGYERAIGRAKAATVSYERELAKLNSDILATEKMLNDEIARKLEAQHQAYTKTGRGMVVAGGALLAGAALAGKAAMDWESAWAGVQKTTSGTPAQMGQLEDGLRGLARTLPATHDEIAAVAEAAGQLGVQRSSIVGFTKVMIDLGQSTNLSADEAATSLARFMNIMQTADGDVSRLGATLVNLGNKGASTEAEIMALGLRLAGAGHIAGMSEAQVLGIANALSSLGINAEAGGSAVSTMIVNWSKAVDTGGAKLEALAEVAGMTSGKFAHLWTTDSAAAFQAVVNGLQRTKDAGGSVLSQLEALGITEIRQRDAMLRLAGSGDVLAKSLRDGAQGWKDNSALLKEAARRYGTTASQVQVAKNQLHDFGIDVGESLLPAIAGISRTIGHLASGLHELPGPLKAIIGPGMALAGALLLLGGGLLMAIPRVAAFNAAVASGDLGPRLTAAGKGAQAAAGGFSRWAGILGLATVALGSFATSAGEASTHADELQRTLDSTSGQATIGTLETINQMLVSKGWSEWARNAGISLEDIDAAVLHGGAAMEKVTGQVNAYHDSLGFVGKRVNSLTGDTGQFISTLEEEHKTLLARGQAQRDSNDATKEASKGQKGLKNTTEDTTHSMRKQTSAAEQLSNALEKVNSAILASRAGARDYQQTLDESRKTLRQGVHTLNIHTQAGRENQAALDGIADATIRWSDALAKTDKSGRSSFKVLQQGRSDLYQTARAFGLSEEAAHAYVNRVLAIPKKWQTKFDTPGSDKAQGEADQTRKKVEDVPKWWSTAFNAETGAAQAGIWNLVSIANRALSSINDETVSLRINEIHTTMSRHVSTAGGRASGGHVDAGKVYRVGEQGEELAMFDSPGVILSNPRTRALASEVAAGGRTNGGSSRGGGGDVTVRLEGPVAIRGGLDLNTGQLVDATISFVRQELDDVAAFNRTMTGRRS